MDKSGTDNNNDNNNNTNGDDEESDDFDDDWDDDSEEMSVMINVKKEANGSDGDNQHDNNNDDDNDDTDDDDDWDQVRRPSKQPATKTVTKPSAATEGTPMLLVDMTVLSNDKIHCKFDPNAVNDPVAVKTLRKSIESTYDRYAKDSKMLADRTVIPCGSSVWRPALQALRKEKPGHYFCPIFPMK